MRKIPVRQPAPPSRWPTVVLMLLLVGVLGGLTIFAAYREQPAYPKQGPQGEPGPAGRDGADGKDCNCDGLRAEAMQYVSDFGGRLTELSERIKRLESTQCKCKCR